MSVINFRKILESLKSVDLEENQINEFFYRDDGKNKPLSKDAKKVRDEMEAKGYHWVDGEGYVKDEVTEGKMNQLSLEIEEWVGEAFERYGHQVGGRDRALMAFIKKFKGFENEFVKRWNDAEMGERPDDYLMNSVDEAEELDEFVEMSPDEIRQRIAGMSNAVATMNPGNKKTIRKYTKEIKSLKKRLRQSKVEEAGFSTARPGENYTDEQHNTDQEMAMEYAKDEGMDWLRSKEGQMYLMSWVEAESSEEKEGALEDLISSLQNTMIMGAYNTMNIDIEISTIQAEKFLGDWMNANGMVQITQESLENIYEGPDKKVSAEGREAAAKGWDRRCPINYRHHDPRVEKAWLKGYDSYKDVDEGSEQASFCDAGRGSQRVPKKKKPKPYKPSPALYDDIGDGAESPKREYWQQVANFLSQSWGVTIRLSDYQVANESRYIEFSGEADIKIYQSWRRDGTASKPVTRLEFNDREEDLGRYSIWPNPREYAEDIQGIMEQAGIFDNDLDEKKDGKELMTTGAWDKAEDPRYTKYDPPKTGNKGVSARKGFVG